MADNTNMISDEQLPSQQKSVPSCTANGNSSSEEEDSTSLANEEKIHQEKAKNREIKLGLRRCYPIIWAGDLFLGQLHSKIEVKFISGDPNVSRAALPPCDIPDSSIYIRMKLSFNDVPQRHIRKKMQAKKESCVLIALPIDNNGTQAAIMDNQFIHYFQQKGVVGVAEFPQGTTTNPIYKMFIFPPSDYVYTSLCKIAPMLADSLYTDICYPHLLCFISPICYCLACEQIKKTRTKTT